MFRSLKVKLLLAICLTVPGPMLAAADKSSGDVKNIVLIAGKKSHGPVGNRIHDYPWSVRLLKVMLENSNIRDKVKVVMHFNGWPKDQSSLKNADTIMVISDGRDGPGCIPSEEHFARRRIHHSRKRVFLIFHCSPQHWQEPLVVGV